MKKICTIGELIVDFLPVDEQQRIYERKMGGAPANVAATIAKLGGDSTFYGMVGDDLFGTFLIDELSRTGVNTSHILKTDKAKTGLAFVDLDKDGNRSFEFYRNPSADMLYTDDDYLTHSSKEDMISFSSVSLVSEPLRTTVLAALSNVKANGGTIYFDINIRANLWRNPEECRDVVHEFMELSDVIKLSEEDMLWLTGSDDFAFALFKIKAFKPRMLILTKGRKGSCIYIDDKEVEVYGYHVNTIDTTGAGDAFMGAFLYQMSLVEEEDFSRISEDDLGEILLFSNAVAAISTTKKGAVEALPTMKEVKKFMSKH